MKNDMLEVISNFIRDKKERLVDPSKSKIEDVKIEIMQKLVEKKSGKKK